MIRCTEYTKGTAEPTGLVFDCRLLEELKAKLKYVDFDSVYYLLEQDGKQFGVPTLETLDSYVIIHDKLYDVLRRDPETVYLQTTEQYCKATGITKDTLIRVIEAEISMLQHSRALYGAALRQLGSLDPRFSAISTIIQDIYKKEAHKTTKLMEYLK